MKELLSKYGTLIVAIIALIQPWVVYLWKKFVRKGEIKIYPTGSIEVGYSSYGPTIGLHGTFRCLNQDVFVSSISLEIVKQKDKSTHSFDWGVFRSQKLTHKGEEAEFELPYGFMLSTSQPKRYNIAFFDTMTRNEMQDKIQNLKEEWIKLLIKEIQEKGIQDETIISKKYYDEFSQAPIHVENYTNLYHLCYWESGKYDLLLRVYTSKPNRIFEERWELSLREEEVKAIRLNALKILQDTCGVKSYGQYNFAYAKYED